MKQRYRPSLVIGSKIQRATHERWIDLSDRRFGMLTVKHPVSSSDRGHKQWLCLCDCGGHTVATTGNLRSGNTRSCGCRQVAAQDNSQQLRDRCQAVLDERLSRLPSPMTLSDIATLFDGDRDRAAKWASEKVRAENLVRVARGVYEKTGYPEN